ncbi:hypothetical protein [Pseudomonas fluorescens]|uniref:Uncharacterized protein n=1 Tax=Pseudomonas fluorescens TaxID=294 RepID=A0A5E7VID7_PSEFL|nr:hypothetical protein [Pseudomonas fluorescens]VVN76890.1 hypothetical protein PS833_00795 [Pseudomonas fluorescens]VVQ22397.1 hypothetical protein PS914_06784 [Pseudomonas fluorescens]
MKGKLLGAAATLAIIGAVTFGLSTWEANENPERDEQCKIARQRVKALEIQARALAAGLSVDGYAEAEKAEVGKLVRALDTAKNEQEVEAVIEAHAATVQAQVAASDAEVKSRGDQLFLEQRLKEQRIPADVKQQLKRAEKAVAIACK